MFEETGSVCRKALAEDRENMEQMKTGNGTLNVQLLMTGNELMSGDTVDTNSVYICQGLKDAGVEVARKVMTGDDLDSLVREMEEMSRAADVLIVNGGLGPTVDDLTAEALSRVAGQPLEIHPVALAQLEQWCLKRGFKLSGPNRKQALLPGGCDIVFNPVGSAPGFSMIHNQCRIICTPGVPVELTAMFSETILPEIVGMLSGTKKVETEKFKTFGIGESDLQKMIDERFPEWPREIELGFRAMMPLLEIKLTSRDQIYSGMRKEWTRKVKDLAGQHVVSVDGTCLAGAVIRELRRMEGKKISTVECGTGGVMASMISGIEGSREVFEAGWISNNNGVTSKVLGIDFRFLEDRGAVSEAAVREMVKGALAKSGADYAVAVSGNGESSGEASYGLAWLGWGDRDRIYAQSLYFPLKPDYFRRYMSSVGLDVMRRLLLGYNETPRYFIERQRRG